MNLQLFARVVDRGNCLEQSIDDVQFVEEWKLDRDYRQLMLSIPRARLRDEFAIAPEVDDLLDAIRAVDRERGENREVDDQDDPVEGVELIKRTDISPGFIYEIVKVPLEEFRGRWAGWAGPRGRCWRLKKHELRYIQRRKILTHEGEHCEPVTAVMGRHGE